jgi:hypothetical protein
MKAFLVITGFALLAGQNLFADTVTCRDPRVHDAYYVAEFSKGETNSVTLTAPKGETSVQKLSGPCIAGEDESESHCASCASPVLACDVKGEGDTAYLVDLWKQGEERWAKVVLRDSVGNHHPLLSLATIKNEQAIACLIA